jgi:hypothetical protein
VQYLGTDDFFNRYAISPTAQRETRLRAIDLFLARTIPEAAGTPLQTLTINATRCMAAFSSRPTVLCGLGPIPLGYNTMSTTILDGLMHHCHLLEFDGRGYRLEEAAERLHEIEKAAK